jgi:toxin ParE1/3/4
VSRYRVARDAELDLLPIFLASMDRFGPRQAERYREAFKREFELLAQFPDMARPRDGWPASVRAFPHGSHVILYEHHDDGIVILRIRHGREDWLGDPLGDADDSDGDAP